MTELNRNDEPETLLTRTAAGDDHARDELFVLLYDRLREIASGLLWGRGGHTLQPTAIVNEAYLKLIGYEHVDRDRFVGLAAKAMRQVVVDQARVRNAIKRGGDRERQPIIESAILGVQEPVDVLVIEDLMKKFEQHDPRAATIVELRLFGGQTHEDIARLLGVSEKTVRNDWRFAKAWFRAALLDAD